MKTSTNDWKKGAIPPGVHFEEAAPEKRPSFETGVPVFIGFGKPKIKTGFKTVNGGRFNIFRFSTWEQFEQCLQCGNPDGFLDYAVRGFFENDGEFCVVIAIQEDGVVSRQIQAVKELFRDCGLLEDIEGPDLICVPDISMHKFSRSSDAVTEIQKEILAHCKRMGDRFAILDSAALNRETGEKINSDTDDYSRELIHHVFEWQKKFPHKGGPVEGAVYFPWIHVQPFHRHANRTIVKIPPCGHIAGIYAHTDNLFGVHKAPANKRIKKALDLEVHVSDKDQANLNECGVNCLRSITGRGIRVWGARTLSHQPNWRYVNIRRLFLTFTRWLEQNMSDLVFEPNGPELWNRTRYRVNTYCRNLYKNGALKGNTPGEAFFVKCDAETNPPDARIAGRLICEVSLAPVVPAEFIIVHIVQDSGSTTVNIPTVI